MARDLPPSGIRSVLSSGEPIAPGSPLAKALMPTPPASGMAMAAVRGVSRWRAGRRAHSLPIPDSTRVVMSPLDSVSLIHEADDYPLVSKILGDVRICGIPVVFDPTVPSGTVRIRSEETIVMSAEQPTKGTQK